MTKEQLEALALKLADGEIEVISSEAIIEAVTASQYITDRCLAELEKRGELEYRDGGLCVPYASDYGVDSPLTR